MEVIFARQGSLGVIGDSVGVIGRSVGLSGGH